LTRQSRSVGRSYRESVSLANSKVLDLFLRRKWLFFDIVILSIVKLAFIPVTFDDLERWMDPS